VEEDVLAVIVDDEPDPADFPARAKLVAERARAFKVETAEDYKIGAEAMRRIKRQRGFLDSIHKPSIKAAKSAHEAAIKAFRTLDDILDSAFETVKSRCEVWLEGQRQEQMRQLAAAKVAISAPVVAAAADEQLAKAFDMAVENGDTAKAAHLLNQAAMPPVMQMTPPPPVATTFVPKVDGISSTTTWSWDCVDESLVPREFLELDRKKITAVVKAMKGQTQIAGIIPRADLGMRVRG